jgi:hypothetical protein
MKGNAHAKPASLQPPPLGAIPPRPKQEVTCGGSSTQKMLKMEIDPAMCMKNNYFKTKFRHGFHLFTAK